MNDPKTIELIVREEDFLNNNSLFKSAIEVITVTFIENKATPALKLKRLLFLDENHSKLSVETPLQENKIPYDKHFDAGKDHPASSEYYRLHQNNEFCRQEFIAHEKDMILIDDAIAAYQQGTIVAFLEKNKNEHAVMSWEDQETIMVARKMCKNNLLKLSSKHRETLLFTLLNSTINESRLLTQELHSDPTKEMEVKALLALIMGKGAEFQVDYLLLHDDFIFELEKEIEPPYLLNDTPMKNTPFVLNDQQLIGGRTHGYIENQSDLGIALHFDGYSDYCSQDDNGTPVYIETINDDLRVVIYADINQEDPTHIISLAKAKNKNRKI